MQLNPFVIGGINGVNVLTKVSAAGANPQVFRPVAGIAVAGGTLITYNNGLIEYLTASNNNAYGNFTFSNYVYGSACDIPQLDPPTSLALGAGNTLTFTPDASAASTTVYVYAGESKLLELPNFTSGSAVHFPLNGSFSVSVRMA